MAQEYTGPEKAAIFLMSIGEENAAKIFEFMGEREIQTLGNHMSALADVDIETMESVRKEFYDAVQSGTGGLGIAGTEFLKSTLMKALDPAKASEILNNVSASSDALEGGLETVRMLDPKTIANFLINEHPQTAAIIMAHLDPAVASAVIKELPEESRTEIVHRLATLERVSPLVIRELDEALQAELRASTAVSGNKMGGVANAAQVIGSLDRATETSILTELDEVDPDLANEIRSLRFTFEDLVKIDDQGLQLVLKDVAQEELSIAMKTASDPLKEKIFSNVSERVAIMLKEDMESMGPTKISEVEKAQKKVVDICRRLEEEGKLIIGGGAEDQYV
ncbi:MAG: flagellar motor switch protein FliG [Nitrospinales bacterium]